MQKRLSEVLKELEENIQVYKDNEDEFSRITILEKVSRIIRDLLLAPDKSFEVTFKGIEYDFIYPTTHEEKNLMLEKASLLSNLIINECVAQFQKGNDAWWMVTAFASGVDTLDMQIEIIGKEEHLNMIDEKGDRVTSLPLDMDNYQINMQKPEIEDVLKDQALDL